MCGDMSTVRGFLARSLPLLSLFFVFVFSSPPRVSFPTIFFLPSCLLLPILCSYFLFLSSFLAFSLPVLSSYLPYLLLFSVFQSCLLTSSFFLPVLPFYFLVSPPYSPPSVSLSNLSYSPHISLSRLLPSLLSSSIPPLFPLSILLFCAPFPRSISS